MTGPDYDSLKDALILPSNSLFLRFRALFTLKSLGTNEAIAVISCAFKPTEKSALFKHECAYVLGQMNSMFAVPILAKLLGDLDEDQMCRHEAAESLGAIGTSVSAEDQNYIKTILEGFAQDKVQVVKETVELALDLLKFHFSSSTDLDIRDEKTTIDYISVDPAPPIQITNVQDLGKVLLDTSNTLFKRYRAMFALRNLGGDASKLAEGFKDPSPLFRHEIAFVFGQMQDELSIPSLKEVLLDSNEHEMVRHEAAEALGSIATEECKAILRKVLSDETDGTLARVIRESCELGLDMYEYESSSQFQYALPVPMKDSENTI